MSESRPCVLVVDDTPANISVAMAALRNDYRVKVATGGVKALEICASDDPPDLILLDIMMPEMDGYEVIRRLKDNPQTADIPVLFLTAQASVEEETRGLELGALDYIHKPFNPSIMQARVKNQLLVKQASDYMRDQNSLLERLVYERTHQLEITQDAIIFALSALAETRDDDTGNHLLRTQRYVAALVKPLEKHGRFADYFEKIDTSMLYKLAPLHDIGKVGIPDSILLKRGRLESEEFAIMKEHPRLGYLALTKALKDDADAGALSFFGIACDIVFAHHEKWDGSGYPSAIGGDDIPIAARLMAVADVYDALISPRVYKTAFSHDKAAQIIIESSGAHFDPDVVNAFVAVQDQFKDIAARYSDTAAKQ